MIERIEGTHRYRVTNFGLRTALFFTLTYNPLLRPGLAEIMTADPPPASKLSPYFDKLHEAMDRCLEEAKLAA